MRLSRQHLKTLDRLYADYPEFEKFDVEDIIDNYRLYSEESGSGWVNPTEENLNEFVHYVSQPKMNIYNTPKGRVYECLGDIDWVYWGLYTKLNIRGVIEAIEDQSLVIYNDRFTYDGYVGYKDSSKGRL